MLPSSCLDGSITPVGPGQNPQYTGAVQRREAVGCSQGLKNEPTKQHGSGVEKSAHPRSTKSARDLHHGKQQVSPFYRDLFRLHIEVRAVTRKTCLERSFLRANNRFLRSIVIYFVF